MGDVVGMKMGLPVSKRKLSEVILSLQDQPQGAAASHPHLSW